jgi:multiple sugar transport system permease protein
MSTQTVTLPATRRRPRRGPGLVGAWHDTRKALPKVVIFIVAFAFFALPLFVLVCSAFNSSATVSFSVPTHPTASNFSSVVASGTGFGTAVLNGFILAGGSALVALVLGAIAAYPLSRFKFRGRIGFLLGVLFVTGVPVTALIVPLFEFFRGFNWLDSTLWVTLLMAAFATPISIWLMKTFVDNVDPALEEAAWMDGANRFEGYVRVVLPIMSTGLLVVFLLNFITGWANFYIPFILLSSTQKLPIAVTIYQFFGSYGQVEYGRLAAFSILYCIPPAVLYVFTGGRLGGSLSSGAFKG